MIRIDTFDKEISDVSLSNELLEGHQKNKIDYKKHSVDDLDNFIISTFESYVT